MRFLKNLKIRNKLLILAVIPLLGMLYFSISEIVQKNRLSSEMKSTIEMSNLAVLVSSLVHETQKERGMTAGFLGSKEKKSQQTLADKGVQRTIR